MAVDPPPETSPARVEVCARHGLRYNAAVDDGCARCRTEAGARALGNSGAAPRRAPDLGRGLLVAGALIVGAGLGLYAAHRLAYEAGHAVFEETIQDVSQPPLDDAEDEDLEQILDEILGED